MGGHEREPRGARVFQIGEPLPQRLRIRALQLERRSAERARRDGLELRDPRRIILEADREPEAVAAARARQRVRSAASARDLGRRSAARAGERACSAASARSAHDREHGRLETRERRPPRRVAE